MTIPRYSQCTQFWSWHMCQLIGSGNVAVENHRSNRAMFSETNCSITRWWIPILGTWIINNNYQYCHVLSTGYAISNGYLRYLTHLTAQRSYLKNPRRPGLSGMPRQAATWEDPGRRPGPKAGKASNKWDFRKKKTISTSIHYIYINMYVHIYIYMYMYIYI